MDPFREIPVRFIGYGMAFGECAKYNFGQRTVDLCNTVGCVYIVVHAVKNGVDAGGSNMLIKMLDTLIFDGIASAIIPSFIAYHVCGITARTLGDINNLPRPVYKWGPFVLGVCSVLLLSTYIDDFVDKLMDQTIRTLY
ncbi:hypothetical protein Btru_070111 [Bulinus truncatus]|nr:hypothetical protein Btru_070111 [Bulinus truncatus]